MYAHIEGIVSEKGADSLVLDCGGVGYLLMVSSNTLAGAPAIGQKMKCYTVLSVREDAMELFGFYSKEEKRMYEKLRGVSGIGPRTAMGILSALTVRELSLALVTGDIAMISRAPNVGRKTAQRLVLELKEKIDNDELVALGAEPVAVGRPENNMQADAIEALMTLGYAQSEAARAVSRVGDSAANVNDLVMLALKGMGG
ncbi:MAG: Holliday junction branch migration protein RuvA [Christensenellales bacterium]|jgi:Holliday junction DNA helicase RuvA